MNVSFFSTDNTKKIEPISGGYEWWYADFIDNETGLSGVIIFYYGNLFSPKYVRSQQTDKNIKPSDVPAVSVSLYKEGKAIYYYFTEFLAKDSRYVELEDGVEYQVGNDLLSYNSQKGIIRFNLDQKQANKTSLKLKLDFLLSGNESTASIPMKNNSTESKHDWRCIMPKAQVKGQIQLNEENTHSIKNALGYHDHNVGKEPLHHFFSDWYWGRCHLEDERATLIYYAYKKGLDLIPLAWLISDNGNLCELNDIEFFNFKKSIFGFKRAKSILINNRFEIEINQTSDSGPFYERYHTIIHDRKSERSYLGIGEYIKPINIYKKWVHQLVEMRLRYNYKSAGVIQSSKLLSSVTWRV